MIPPQGNVALIHPGLPAVQTRLWESGVDAEMSTAVQDLTSAPTVSTAASILGPALVETQSQTQTPALVAAQNQPLSASYQAEVMPQAMDPTFVNDPLSVPIQVPTAVQTIAPVQAPISASDLPFESPKDLSKSLAQAPVAASVPAAVLQPAGIQTAGSVSESASVATIQQNFESTSASGTLQQESCLEVCMFFACNIDQYTYAYILTKTACFIYSCKNPFCR